MRLDLDEDQGAPVESDQVDLAVTRTVVASEQRKATSPKMLARELLAVPAQCTTMIPATTILTPRGANAQESIKRITQTALIDGHTKNATATNATNHTRM